MFLEQTLCSPYLNHILKSKVNNSKKQPLLAKQQYLQQHQHMEILPKMC